MAITLAPRVQIKHHSSRGLQAKVRKQKGVDAHLVENGEHQYTLQPKKKDTLLSRA